MRRISKAALDDASGGDGIMIKAVQLIAAAAILLMTSAPAFAGDADCLWRHLPAETRQQIVDAYAAKGRDGLNDLNVTDTQVSASLKACGNTAPSDRAGVMAVGGALVGISLQEASAHLIAQEEGVTPRQLAQAWLKISAPQRQALETMVVESLQGAPTAPDPAGAAALEEAVRSAGWRPGASGERFHQLLLDHYQGRAEQEAFSQMF